MYGLVRVGERTQSVYVWWSDEVKAAVKRNEDAYKQVLGTRDEAE